MNWECFRTNRSLATLDDHDLEVLGALGRPLSFQAGDPLMVADKKGDAFYLVVAGKVEVWAQKEGERQSIAILSIGQIVGERALLYANRIANVNAVEPTELIEISYADFQTLEQTHPHTYHLFLRAMAQLADARTWTAPLDMMINHYLALFSKK